MAIIDKQVYKLDNHDIKISNALCRCFEGEKYCNEMLKNLIFYDAGVISRKYVEYIARKGDYNPSELEQITCLDQDEKFARIVPVEKNWLAVFIKNAKTNEILQNKIMYLSVGGEGYVSDDVKSALEGNVPREVHLRHLEEDLRSFNELDKKYFDGTHDDFLAEFFAKARAILTEYFVSVIKSEESQILNQEIKQREDITLEEIRMIIDEEFRRKPRAEDFHIYDAMDLVYHNLGCDLVVELSNKYKLPEILNENNYQEK